MEKLHKTLKEECGLDPQLPLLVAVSGGADSLCLLDILHLFGYQLIVAYFDHSLRSESAQDGQKVRWEAERRGLRFVTEKQEVAALAREQHLSIEEAARVARYAFLFRQARLFQAQGIAVAHTADDQVETVLMHLVRGAGVAGLKGMAYRVIHPEWDQKIPLVRPLLEAWRSEVEAYCHMHGLQPLRDPTNEDTTFFRNRLRHELIPFLADYNPRIKQTLLRMSQNMAGDYEVLQAAIQKTWEQVFIRQRASFVELSASLLRSHRRGMQRGVLRRAIACLRPALRDVDFEAVERALNFLQTPSVGRRVDLVNGLVMWVEDERLFLAEEEATVLDEGWPQMPPGEELLVPVPGVVRLGDWRVESSLLEKVDVSALTEAMQDRWQTWLDADSLRLPLVLRARWPGDRFQPLGMEGHSMKLSDFMVNEGLNRRARDGWPLVCSGEKIVSVPGFRPAEDSKLIPATQRVVHLQWFPPPEAGE